MRHGQKRNRVEVEQPGAWQEFLGLNRQFVGAGLELHGTEHEAVEPVGAGRFDAGV